MKKWKPSCKYLEYEYSEYYVAYSKTRDSGYTIISNFDYIKSRLKNPTIITINHWIYGEGEIIFIHESNVEDIKMMETIEKMLEEYPILNEDIFVEYIEKEYSRIYSEIKNDCKNGFGKWWDLPDYCDDDELICNKADETISDFY